MKFTKSLSAVTAVLFAGSLALTGCSTGGAEKTQEKPTVDKNIYNVEVEAPDGAKKPLVANVRSKVEVTDETIEKEAKKHPKDDIKDAKGTLKKQIKALPQVIGVSEDQVRLTSESHNVAYVEVDRVPMDKLYKMLRIKASHTDKGTYRVEIRPMLLEPVAEGNVRDEVNVTLPEPIEKANISGKVDGNTVTWTSDNYAEAMEGIEIVPGEMFDTDGKSLIAETRPTNTDK